MLLSSVSVHVYDKYNKDDKETKDMRQDSPSIQHDSKNGEGHDGWNILAGNDYSNLDKNHQ